LRAQSLESPANQAFTALRTRHRPSPVAECGNRDTTIPSRHVHRSGSLGSGATRGGDDRLGSGQARNWAANLTAGPGCERWIARAPRGRRCGGVAGVDRRGAQWESIGGEWVSAPPASAQHRDRSGSAFSMATKTLVVLYEGKEAGCSSAPSAHHRRRRTGNAAALPRAWKPLDCAHSPISRAIRRVAQRLLPISSIPKPLSRPNLTSSHFGTPRGGRHLVKNTSVRPLR
jgi:hypothetical protein